MKQGFPGGSVVKNPPANAGDMDSIPGLGRFHMPGGPKPITQLLSLCPRAQGATTIEPTCHNYKARAPQQEKTPPWKPCALQQGVSPARRN